MASFRSIKNPIVLAIFRAAIFWWLLLALFDVENYGVEVIDPDEVLLRMTFLCVGILTGFFYIAFEVHAFRSAQRKGTEKGNRRGLFSSLGPPPLLKTAPAQAKDIPSKLPYPPDINDRFLDQWLAKYETTHPAHANLMKALLRVYAFDLSLPATHIEGGHGGRTLMTHSLLVCGLMLRLAETWGYSGLRGKSGRLVLPLRDPGYVFTPNDPMVGITALAHDIGKIECYLKDAKGRVIDSKFEHDQVGGRMLGRMDEVWALPDADRSLLTSVVSFYHRPQDLPLANGGLACDDRTIAMMELLIRADATASRLENGQTEKEAANCDQEAPEQEKDSMWGAFCELMMQSGRINGPSASFRLGQKNSSETGSALVYLHETSLRKALAKQMGIDEGPQLGDRSYMLTRSLLKVLQEHGVLYQHHNEATFSDSRALFKVEFHNKKGEPLATWPATIIIEPGLVLPVLSNLPDFTSFPTICRATFGAHSAKNKRQDLLSALADGADPDSFMEIAASETDGEPPTDGQPKKKTRKTRGIPAETSDGETPLSEAPSAATPSPAVNDTAGDAPTPVAEAPPRPPSPPADIQGLPLVDQLIYLRSNAVLQSKTLPDGRTAIRTDWLPESLEQQLITMDPLPDSFERLVRGERTFLLFNEPLLKGSPTPDIDPAPASPEYSAVFVPPVQEPHPAAPSEDASQAGWVNDANQVADQEVDIKVADAAVTEDVDDEINSDDMVNDDFDEYTEEPGAPSEEDDGGMVIAMPSGDEIEGIEGNPVSEDGWPPHVRDSSSPAAPDQTPPISETFTSVAKGSAADDRQEVLAAEKVLRMQVKQGRIPYKQLPDGTLVITLPEAIKFNRRWETLPKLILASGNIESIRFVDRGDIQAFLLAPLK